MTSPSHARRSAVLGAALAALLAPLAMAAPAGASGTANEVVYIADADNDGAYSLVLQDLGTGRVSTVLPADPANGWIHDDPELSRDGLRIALSTDRGSTAGDEGIAVVSRAGGAVQRLTEPRTPAPPAGAYVYDVAPAWSPDGGRIVFTRITEAADGTVSTALFTVGTGTTPGAPVRLTTAVNGYTADWSPDGLRIVYAAPAPGSDSGPLRTVLADGTGAATDLGPTGLMPAWSADGTTIAYTTVTARDTNTSRGWDTAQIATVPATGGVQKVLAPTKPTSSATVAEYPTWLPDGESILYDLFGFRAGATFPPGDLWAVDRNGLRAGRVTASAGDEAQGSVHGPVPSPIVSGAASTYTALAPTRVLDTRPGAGNVGAPAGRVRSGADLRLDLSGAVPVGTTAVVLNLTVTSPSAPMAVTAYPDGTTPPPTSNVNAAVGQTVPNLVTVRLGADRALRLKVSAGEAHLIADLAGSYAPSATASKYEPIAPVRVLDTRPGAGNVGAPPARVGTAPLELSLGARVPAGATAVVLNVTGVKPTATTFVQAYPGGEPAPTASNLNLRAGQVLANLVTVKVSPARTVLLRNDVGTVDLLADLAGYYGADASASFVPVDPSRLVDTRTGAGGAPIPMTAAGYADIRVAGSPRGIPAGATAAVLNVTGTNVSSATYLSAFPSPADLASRPAPGVSTVNLAAGSTRANLSVVQVGPTGRVRLRNDAGSVDTIADIAGYMVG